MKPVVLTLQQPPPARIDASLLRPDLWSGHSADHIRRMPLTVGRQTVSVGDLFTVEEGDSDHLVIHDSTGTGRLDSLGAGLGAGRISYYGMSGAFLGRNMQGGEIEVHGDVGDWAASGMRNGLIRIRGNAGDFLGGADTGEMRGMRGGSVIVHGNTGQRAADRMRRGTLLVEGNAGDYCASRMIAGTVVILGKVGSGLGFGMRRGTVVLSAAPTPIGPTFVDCGTGDFRFLTLLARHCAALDFPALGAARARRLVGDRANDGKAELLFPG